MEYKGLLSRRDFLAAGAATIAGSSLLSVAGCGGAVAIGNSDVYTLDLVYKEYTLDGLRLRTRSFNGMIPGPTMYTAPGRRMTVIVNNNLPPNPPPGDGGPAGGGHGGMRPTKAIEAQNPNDPHEFNTTNLHIHGLQIIPHLFEPLGTLNPSAPMLKIEPGESYTYNVDIPEDQPSGLYWYHPHKHGSTAVQVYSGMAGMIVCRGPIDEVPEIKAAREEFIAVQCVRVSPSVDDPDLWVQEPIANEPASEGGFTDNQLRNFFLVNGHPAAWFAQETDAPVTQLGVETIMMRPGEVVRFRMLNGTDTQLMPMVLDGHHLEVIAYDGVNLLEPQSLDEVEVPPGGRLEFLVKAKEAGTYGLRMMPVIGQQFSDCNGFLLVNITVSGAAKEMALPTSLPMPTREYPFIEDGDLTGFNQLEFSVVAPFPELYVDTAFRINNLLYEETRVDRTMHLGQAEEWTLSATGAEGHPFHIHVNSFWVVEVDGVKLDPPIVKDVVFIKKGSSVKIRQRYKQWTGKSVYHCHILFHEDTGMMQNFVIQP